ncbi:MAG TPA: TlpA disulfide reductase family protein [Terriglobia bacterium]|nr:TlpA disulfide reductase family protein [Terriglobia bacterium]
MSAVAAGKAAPAFELTSTEGKPYSLKQALERGPVLAAFFKVGCPTCQYTFPFLERLYQQFREKGVALWGIVQDNARDAQRFAKTFGINFPILIDDKPYETSQQYGLEYVPTILLISPDGQVEISSDGFSKRDLLEIQKSLADHFSVEPPALFQPGEKVPEFKPG